MKISLIVLIYLLNPCLLFAQLFSPVGSGLSIGGNVRSLSVDSTNEILYASGWFSYSGSGIPMSGVAKWNGGDWDSIYSGINGGTIGYTTAFHNSLVYFGGSFQTFAGLPDTGLAIFDGTSMIASANVVKNGFNGAVQGIFPIGQDVYVVGYRGLLDGQLFNQVAKWDGTSWTQYPMLDSLMGWPVFTAAVYNNELYVGGNFEGYGSPYMKDLAKFNGTTWVPVGNGLSGFNTAVNTILVYDGKLIVGGGFKTSYGDPGNNIAAWDGNSWSQLGSGIDGARVSAMKVIGNNLYVGGQFSNAGGVAAQNIARWDGTQWHSIGAIFDANGVVLCLEQLNNELIIGGQFQSINGITMNHVAKYSIPTGMDEPNFSVEATANIYPNPAQHSISISISHHINGNMQIEIVNVLGETVIKEQLSRYNSEIQILLEPKISNGIYLCKVYNQDFNLIKRFVVER